MPATASTAFATIPFGFDFAPPFDADGRDVVLPPDVFFAVEEPERARDFAPAELDVERELPPDFADETDFLDVAELALPVAFFAEVDELFEGLLVDLLFEDEPDRDAAVLDVRDPEPDDFVEPDFEPDDFLVVAMYLSSDTKLVCKLNASDGAINIPTWNHLVR
jgi:hypothetical protein